MALIYMITCRISGKRECRNSFRTAAQEMHDFLVSLRPQQET